MRLSRLARCETMHVHILLHEMTTARSGAVVLFQLPWLALPQPCAMPLTPHCPVSLPLLQVSPGQYVGQVALLPSDPAAAAIAASGAALTAALAGLPASGAAAVAAVARRLSEDEFELYLEVSSIETLC